MLNCDISPNQLNIQSAIRFLLKNQIEQGGWGENPQLAFPKNVIELSTSEGVTWLTADIIVLLRKVGLEKNDQYIKALNWLKHMQTEKGSWSMFEGDRFGEDSDSSAQILFLMKDIYGTDNSIWIKGIKRFEEFLDNMVVDIERGYFTPSTGGKRRNDIYHLTYYINR